MVPSHAWRRRRRWAPTLAICHNTNKPVRPSKGVPGSGVAVGKLLLPFEIVPHPFAPCDSIKMSLSMVISDTGANAADVCRKPLVGPWSTRSSWSAVGHCPAPVTTLPKQKNSEYYIESGMLLTVSVIPRTASSTEGAHEAVMTPWEISESIPSPAPATFHALEKSKPGSAGLPEGVTRILLAEGPGRSGK